jgi:hypothetical protein
MLCHDILCERHGSSTLARDQYDSQVITVDVIHRSFQGSSCNRDHDFDFLFVLRDRCALDIPWGFAETVDMDLLAVFRFGLELAICFGAFAELIVVEPS